MPTTTAARGVPGATVLTTDEREVLYALGCGLGDAEIADALALPAHAVGERIGRVLEKLGLSDRAAAVVHAFDCGLVVPGQGPRRQPRAPGNTTGRRTDAGSGPWLRVSLLGPLRTTLAGRPVDAGPLRQQAVLAALALGAGRSVSRRQLLDGVWGEEMPDGNVVPVYVYRLRKSLRLGEQRPDSVIRRDRYGYGLVRGVAEVDVLCVEDLVTRSGQAERAGDLPEAVRLCARALELFRGEPLAGLPGPLAESERLRLAGRRVALARRKADWQLALGRHAEAIAELSALALEEPLDEPVAATLMHALRHGDRRAEALAVFDRTARRLAGDLGVAPGDVLLRARRAVLHGDAAGTGRVRAGAA
ncbi:BTAD domain-containing putative transcriptional regulator [Streptomyces sp. NPDC048737]|uniref:BTAD domain-containing putative transcriptional regulator n=1 Tax=unclassified Streptomyces TaxID=2593676 RepID=UPI0034212273